jgi:hypothetical protein
VRVRGVATKGVGWASGEVFDLRVNGLDASLRYVEELQVLTEVLLVH